MKLFQLLVATSCTVAAFTTRLPPRLLSTWRDRGLYGPYQLAKQGDTEDSLKRWNVLLHPAEDRVELLGEKIPDHLSYGAAAFGELSNSTAMLAISGYWQDLHPKLIHLLEEEKKIVEFAMKVSYFAHDGQTRKSGEPYITHPVEVAGLLAELGMDSDTIVSGLLHDTVEDTDLTFLQVELLFGPTVRKIVEGETKVSKLPKVMTCLANPS